jgi:ABC-type transporter Mla maintaining outer membrane lipid asymmetry ATPase subunit MlaF
MTLDSPSEPVLSFENVRIGFDEGNVLDGLSFSVAPRETKVLIGESGTGKTLILKMAAGPKRNCSAFAGRLDLCFRKAPFSIP